MKRLFLMGSLILAGSLISPSAFAIPIVPNNPRPVAVTIPSSDGPGTDLQTIVNTVFPGAGIIVNNPGSTQSTSGMWANTSAYYPISVPTLLFEYAGLKNVNTFGIWSGNDTTAVTGVDIFSGPANPGTFAVLSWDTPGTNQLTISGGPGVNNTTIIGIDPTSFGFYIKNSNGTFYTIDQLNPGGQAMVVAFNKPKTDTWLFGFEDIPSGDKDFNDMVVRVESIVPEPSTLILLGSGFLGFGFLARRKTKG